MLDERYRTVLEARTRHPEAIAEAYWQLYQQPRDAWSFEHEIRPFGEKW